MMKMFECVCVMKKLIIVKVWELRVIPDDYISWIISELLVDFCIVYSVIN